MRVGAKYVSKSGKKDYILITKVEDGRCYYNFSTAGGIVAGSETQIASIATVLGWGTLVNPRIKY